MNKTRQHNREIEAIVWGLLLIWWGLRWWPLISLPNGTGLFGTGVILLSVSAARSLYRLPTNRFMTILGIIALYFGGLLVALGFIDAHLEIPILETALIIVGITLVVRELLWWRKESQRDLHSYSKGVNGDVPRKRKRHG